MNDEIKVGDVVELKSGGLKWTVRSVAPLERGGETFVVVVACTANGVQRDQMPAVCFVKVAS